uniref:Uncharacterized protein n=1 Tax=Anguilla anguilla TaxID=7936 RepID=A0A0E9TEL5_ANGAN
MHAETSFSSYV